MSEKNLKHCYSNLHRYLHRYLPMQAEQAENRWADQNYETVHLPQKIF